MLMNKGDEKRVELEGAYVGRLWMECERDEEKRMVCECQA